MGDAAQAKKIAKEIVEIAQNRMILHFPGYIVVGTGFAPMGVRNSVAELTFVFPGPERDR